MRIRFTAVAAIALAIAAPAFACNDHAAGAPKRSLSQLSAWVDGEVREVDHDEHTITLAHGRIARWRMEPMSSMPFRARDTALLANVKPGDKVRFRAAIVDDRPVVTAIRLGRR